MMKVCGGWCELGKVKGAFFFSLSHKDFFHKWQCFLGQVTICNKIMKIFKALAHSLIFFKLCLIALFPYLTIYYYPKFDLNLFSCLYYFIIVLLLARSLFFTYVIQTAVLTESKCRNKRKMTKIPVPKNSKLTKKKWFCNVLW